MSSLLRVRPTKIELIKLRRRLALASKVQRILRERLLILINEFMLRVREAYSFRKKIYDKYSSVYSRSIFLLSNHGLNLFDYYKSVTTRETRVVVGLENIMGVKARTVIVNPVEQVKLLYPGLDSFQKDAYELIVSIIELGRLEQSIYALGKEIEKTRRKVNALKYIVIPRLENTIRFLRMKFEEREREEKSRLKRIKSLLERGGVV